MRSTRSRSFWIPASLAALYALNSSGVHRFFFVIVVLLVFAQDRQDLEGVARDVGEPTDDLHDLVAVDPLLFVHACRVPGARGTRKTSVADTTWKPRSSRVTRYL